ncbi:MAG: phosphotransferase family protein [Proteobacteria bacterium]|nr:phosphotransferase family protein [Pseudomonadota bacterium]
MHLSDLASKLEAYMKHRLPDAKNITVKDLERIHGGASRETYRLRMCYSDDNGSMGEPLILRLDPERSLVETEHANEYFAYRAFFGTDVPVPEPVWLEEDTQWLGNPFFVMRQILGCEADRDKLAEPPYLEVREAIGEQYARIIGRISRIDPAEIGLTEKMKAPKPDECWRQELDYWEGMIDQDEQEPQPVVRAAIRWLRGNPPPPASKIAVVHGDYRIGNFLYDEDGSIHSILDWEMCHLGDPMEDIAWGMNPLWSFNDQDKVGGMITRQRFVELWEEESGLKVEPEALYWWELFTGVKALSIWIDAGRKYFDKTNTDIILGHTGWIATDVQSFVIYNKMRSQL